MSTEKFRRQLRDESERWWREGLIDAELYETLAERYTFVEIESANSNRFITILMGLGGILLGLGAITLVAANWQVWSRALRMGVIFSAFLMVNTVGFYCWRQAARKPGLQRQRGGSLEVEDIGRRQPQVWGGAVPPFAPPIPTPLPIPLYSKT